ncbi:MULTISPECIES: hypothetical protein [Enterobacter]|jgi:hypothetical protein|uniref:hypothetical protein n=1 Tax=Enterobacter TaxID=547 RepID=UPI00079C66B9|nr:MULTISPECIES: hypothetical protein [Enterobacter]EKS7107841.1 hypothetical protein [Enterobacter ludwigii]ELN9421817.1 hypothetical protein [Enterobacter ludwigii]MBS0870612.1 hypothetical protein [Enterobacter ludwigii]MBX8879214.1 DUF4112 domain-containing protein [Enterobacter ludwigii]MDH1545705.1 hypothetical protein [Enterobacter ludwigii]
MSGVSVAWFKETSLETGQWIWGTLQGAFNEKQTIGQIIVDAVIGMIPLVGDVTAVRDLIAVSIGLAKEPKKRESVTEWVFLVILLFALIPVIGGVIKGVGRLALRVTTKAAENVETLGAVIKFLNRIGEGDAVKWLNKQNVVEYQAELIEKMSDFCNTMITAINQILKARVGRMLPEKWQADLLRVRDGFTALQQLASRMIPQALKELDAKLRVLQALVYKGEIHTIATGTGRAEVRREAEAYLIERPLREALKQGTRYPSVHAEELYKTTLRRKYSKAGYPDLIRSKGKSPAFGNKPVFTSIASFSGDITAKSARDMAGSTIFRAFGNPTDLAPNGSWAAGGFWGYQKVPGSAEEWRQLSAVLDEWNGNGFLVVLHLPEDLATRMPGSNAWHGKIAEQFGSAIPAQYLKGGGEQVIINLDEMLKQEVNRIGEQVKAIGQAASVEINGVKAEFYPTNWQDVNGVHGYSKPEGIEPPYATTTRELHDDELRSKVTDRTILNAARFERQTTTGSEQ